MLTSSDFITIPYTPDMTQAGIAYACKSLHFTYNRMGTSPVKRLQRIVAGVAVELAFRRLLAAKQIPHDNLGATPFTDPDRYDIAIGGRRCDIKSFLLTHKERISQVRQQPANLLEAQALVPLDQIKADRGTDDDIFIFAFLNALLTPNQATLKKALAAEQPVYLIYTLPKHWARPQAWQPLGALTLKSNASQLLKIELNGQDPMRSPQKEQFILRPGKRVTARKTFFALNSLHSPQHADGQIGIHSPVLNETRVIQPLDWGNIWVYGMEINFCGYMPRGEFRQKAETLPAGSRVFQYPRTRTPNLSLPMKALYPLSELFQQAKVWKNSTIGMKKP